MKKLQITARLNIHEGKLKEFREIAEACLISTRDKDEGTLRYDWFFNEEQTGCVVHELYEDSDALLQHISNLGETFGKILSVSDMSVEIYGTPSAELMKATEGLDVEVYSYFQGL